MDEIRRLLNENAVLPLWPQTGKMLNLSRNGEVSMRSLDGDEPRPRR